jgi:BASS family bile acid:Na+ symporter
MNGLILRLLVWPGRHGSVLLACGIFGGIAIAPLAESLRGAIPICVPGLMTLVLLRLDIAPVLAYLRRPALVLGLCAWCLLACPLLAFAATRAFGLDGPLGSGLVLMAASCVLTAAPAFARLAGLDAELALVLAVLSMALMPFTAPPLALGLLGLDLSISVGGLMLRLLLVVGLPALLAWAIRHRLGLARLEALGPALDGVVVLTLMGFGFGVMAGVQARLLADPLWVAGGVALAMAGNLGLNALTALAFLPRGRHLALTAGLLAGNRNQAIFLAVLPATADPSLLMFFAFGQVPMYLTPFLLKPIYGRFAGRAA